jgi:hypothetical protein
MTSIIQDPSLVVYDRLFFELSRGNYDVYFFHDSPTFIEEYLVVRPIFKELLLADTEKLTCLSYKNRSMARFSKNKMKNWGERLLIYLIIISGVKFLVGDFFLGKFD